MTSPQTYQEKLAAIGLENWTFTVYTIQQSRSVLTQIHAFEKQLQQLREEILADIQAMQQKAEQTSSSSLGRKLGSLFGKRTAKAQPLDSNETLAAYQALLIEITNQLNYLEEETLGLKSYIDELKASQPRKKTPKPKPKPVESQVEYYAYIQTQEWREKAEEAKARAGNRCQVCNRSRSAVQLDAHHRTYERLGRERLEDITVLCRDCHQLYEDAKKLPPKPEKPAPPAPPQPEPESGHCIRCKKSISLAPQSPYCYDCYKVWRKFGNMTYEENHCHICGKENPSTRLKPVCYGCYKQHRDLLPFSQTSQ